MNIEELTPAQICILTLLKAPDINNVKNAPIPGRIHLTKEIFAFSTTPLGKKLLTDLNFEPDNFGPFDETIFAAVDELYDAKIINYYQISKNKMCIKLSTKGEKLATTLWNKLKDDVKNTFIYIKKNFNHHSSEYVLQQIYRAYPQMTKYSISNVAKQVELRRDT
ncbi:MAG: hypothetical protein HZB92_06755 [Euryarchaeota archaeon]|nr:hypothetical protein [Euryarchaeota archaeon]